MKPKHWITLLAALAVGFLSPSLTAQPAGKSGDVQTAVRQLVTQIQQKLKDLSGSEPTEAQFSSELAQFDKVIADNPNASANDLAEVLLMKSGFYVEVLNNYDKAEALVRRVKTDYPTSDAAAHLDEILKQLGQYRTAQATKSELKEGTVFPDFSVTDVKGNPLSVSQFKGKVVLVDFWATWCPPCVKEIPHVLAAYAKYHSKGFEVVGISGDRTKDDLLKYIEKNQIPWPQYFEGENPEASLSEKYGVKVIPTTFLIGPDGKIVAINLRGDELEAQLAKLLK